MNQRKSFIVFLLFISLFITLPVTAFAAIIYSQPVNSGTIAAGENVFFQATANGVMRHFRIHTSSTTPFYTRGYVWCPVGSCSSWSTGIGGSGSNYDAVSRETYYDGNGVIDYYFSDDDIAEITDYTNMPSVDFAVRYSYGGMPTGDDFFSGTALCESSHPCQADGTMTVPGLGTINYGKYKLLVDSDKQILTISANITSTTVWQSDIIYVISGDIEVTSGDTLTIEPGTVIKFDEGSSLTISGTMVAEGEENDDSLNQIFFTSLADDSVGGDTNGDGNSTSPAAGDWEEIGIASGGSASFEYATTRYGGDGASDAQLHNNGGTLTMDQSTVAHGTVYGIKNTSGTAAVSNSDIGFHGYGFYLGGGTASVTDGNKIHDNDLYGIYNNTVSAIDAEDNYWGDPTGPYHSVNNTGGLGNAVSDYVDFNPWDNLLHYILNEIYSAYCSSFNSCTSVYSDELQWKNDGVTSYTAELSSAIATWDAEGDVDFIEDNSTPALELSEVDLDDVIWKGKWIPEDTPDAIKLNSYFLDGNTSNQIENTILHELGHALGLGHSFTGNVMYFNQTSQAALGSQDISDYEYLWQ